MSKVLHKTADYSLLLIKFLLLYQIANVANASEVNQVNNISQPQLSTPTSEVTPSEMAQVK